MAKPASPHKATGNQPQIKAAGDREGGTAAQNPPPTPVDPSNDPPSRGGK